MNALNDILKLKSAEAAGLGGEPRMTQRTEITERPEQPLESGIKRFASAQFPGAIERDTDALLLQLESLGLRLFVDETGRNGRQFPAGEFGHIDLLTTDMSGNFVVIDFKSDEAPSTTIGQMAGYMAFVKKNLVKASGHSVTGWILARPSFSTDDGILEEAAEAIGMKVKWYWVKLEFLENRGA